MPSIIIIFRTSPSCYGSIIDTPLNTTHNTGAEMEGLKPLPPPPNMGRCQGPSNSLFSFFFLPYITSFLILQCLAQLLKISWKLLLLSEHTATSALVAGFPNLASACSSLTCEALIQISMLDRTIDTTDYVHGIGNRKLTHYIHVHPPMHFLFTFGSWIMAEIWPPRRFRIHAGPRDTSTVSTKA
jgi:hypothetical protein